MLSTRINNVCVFCTGGKAYGQLKDEQMKSLGEINEVHMLRNGIEIYKINDNEVAFCLMNKRCIGCVWCILKSH